MKLTKTKSIILAMFALLLVANCIISGSPMFAQAATYTITTPPTGYKTADDVVYKQSGKYIANWGARGEDCLFLSKYAQQFYSGENTYESWSSLAGGTTQQNAPSSQLYSQLKSFMSSKHSYITTYDGTRDMYRYTDCVSSNTNNISSFYSGKTLNGAWDSGATWNREHTWPNSKGDDSGKGENDIMMLRPASVSENSGRGNVAYGESTGYYDPGVSVRGDCARIMLYVYTRWGNTGKMWGTGGVMENVDVLLRWIAEDPVDTWEMGRNDAVQYITGTRNVFVDYPELAFQLFGRFAPSTMSTPSGGAGSETDNPNFDASEFINAVASIDYAKTLTAKYGAIQKASQIFNGYTIAQKQQVSTAYDKLVDHITTYNNLVSQQNDNSKSSLAVATASVSAVIAVTALAFVFGKRFI